MEPFRSNSIPLDSIVPETTLHPWNNPFCYPGPQETRQAISSLSNQSNHLIEIVKRLISSGNQVMAENVGKNFKELVDSYQIQPGCLSRCFSLPTYILEFNRQLEVIPNPLMELIATGNTSGRIGNRDNVSLTLSSSSSRAKESDSSQHVTNATLSHTLIHSTKYSASIDKINGDENIDSISGNVSLPLSSSSSRSTNSDSSQHVTNVLTLHPPACPVASPEPDESK